MTLEEAKQRKAAVDGEFRKKVAVERGLIDTRIASAIDSGIDSFSLRFSSGCSFPVEKEVIESLRRDGFTVIEHKALSSHPCEQAYTEVSGW